jgi:hypothetical protein
MASIRYEQLARIYHTEESMPPLTPDQWLALSPYLDTALEMNPAERGIWLSSLRQGNPTLADQLEILLENHRALLEEGFLESNR